MSPTLAALTRRGAHWLGSASVLITNEAGSLHWRTLDCVQTGTVLNPPADPTSGSTLTAESKQPLGGVVELSGSAGTYQMQLAAKRTA